MAEQDAAYGKVCSRAILISAAGCVRWRRWARCWPPTPPGPADAPQRFGGAGQYVPIVSWDAKTEVIKVAPIATWADDDLAEYVETTADDQPAARRGLSVHRPRSRDAQGRRPRRPSRTLGSAWPRPNAGSTCETRTSTLIMSRTVGCGVIAPTRPVRRCGSPGCCLGRQIDDRPRARSASRGIGTAGAGAGRRRGATRISPPDWGFDRASRDSTCGGSAGSPGCSPRTAWIGAGPGDRPVRGRPPWRP